MKPPELTERLIAILALAAADLPDKTIASILQISIHTVTANWKDIRAHFRVQSRVAALARWYEFRYLANDRNPTQT